MGFRTRSSCTTAAIVATVWIALPATQPLLLADDFFSDPDSQHQSFTEQYRSPVWEGIDWKPGPVVEATLVGAEAFELVLAVGSNFTSPTEAPRPYVRSMTLYMANRLRPGDRAVRLADHQLKHRRHPVPVGRWSDRDELGGALWDLAWNAHSVATPHSDAGLLLLDLAAAFDPSELESMERYRRLSKGGMEGRWLPAVRLPDGIDAPDISPDRQVAEGGSDNTGAGAGTQGEDPEPEEAAPFAFQIREAAILVPTGDGGFARLEAKAHQFDAKFLRDRHAATTREIGNAKKRAKPAPYVEPKVAIDFQPGRYGATFAPLVMAELARARDEFVRRRQDVDFPRAYGVRFKLGGGETIPQIKGALSAAAGVLLESMAEGIALADSAATAGMLGFGSTMLLGELALADLLEAESRRGVRLAVPEAASGAVADLAALGDYQTLMNVQLLGCARLDDALGPLGAEPDPEHLRAFALFAEIGRAADRVAPDALLRNPLVRVRLDEVVELCPQHLSAAALLRIARGEPGAGTASLTGSVHRLRRLEEQVRSWVGSHLGTSATQDTGGNASDGDCATALAELRYLRPHLHPRARDYDDRLFELVQDLRESLRSGGSGPTVTARRADALKTALDSLTLEVAAIGIGKP